MRNLVKVGLLSVALLATAVINAAEKIKVTIEESSNELSISIEDVVIGEKINVTDRKGNSIMSETVTDVNNFTKKLDFSELTQGVYTIETVTSKETKVTPFIINPRLGKVVKGTTKTYMAPTFTFGDGVVTINVVNKDKNPVTISVSGGGHELDLISKNTSESITQAYSFSKLSGGDYYILVTQGDHYFTKELNLF